MALFKNFSIKFPLKLSTTLSAWILITVIQIVNQLVNHIAAGYDYDFSYRYVITKSLINNGSWVLLLPLISFSLEKFRGMINPFRLNSLFFGLLFLVVPLIHRSVSLLLYNFAFAISSGHLRSFFGPNNLSELLGGYFLSILEMVVVLAVLITLDYQKKLANKEKDLVSAQLQALRMQLHPHFLFNTLHSISSMMDINIKEAQKMITRVGDMFRTLLERDEKNFVTLAEEMSFIKNYLELEHIRFQDRLKLNIAIEAEDNTLMPSMILQPVIENSIKYGVNMQAADSYIDICIKKLTSNGKSERLLLSVVNGSKTPLKKTKNNGFGISHKNIKRRLAQSYNSNYECRFRMLDEYTYESEIIIPLNYD